MPRLPVLLATAAIAAAPASAETLAIALKSEPTAIDPHYHDLGPNSALAEHVFDALVRQDAQLKIHPELATAWERSDDNTWVFDLRQGVTFSNGDAFTADDVIFSLCRTLNNETGLGSFTDVANNLAAAEASDEHTLVLTTEIPSPLLLADLADLAIISASIVEHGELTFDPANGCGVTGAWPTVDLFNDLSAAIGTGPYEVTSYAKGSEIRLTAHEGYWGEPPAFDEVTFTAVPSEGPRLAGLLAGDYDLVEDPAPRDLPRVRDNPDLDFTMVPSNRVLFLQLDTFRTPEDSPGLQAEGANPFKDVRVRRAMAMAIDRAGIVEHVMDGIATPAYQFLPDGMFGALPEPPVIAYDPDEAKRLLAEAGYPDGFEVTLATPNDRYINDERVAQAVAQFLSRVGIQTSIDAMSRSIFFPSRRALEFSLSMGGWGSSSGEASSFLQAFVTTKNDALDVGQSNYGRFSDPAFDEVFLAAIQTMDPEQREPLLQESVTMALDRMPLIPLHFESSTWAFRKGITYPGRSDQMTLATEIERME